MEATITTKYDLRQKVYVAVRSQVYYGEISRVTAEKDYIFAYSAWKYYYNVRISEDDSIYNVSESRVFLTKEEAEAYLKK